MMAWWQGVSHIASCAGPWVVGWDIPDRQAACALAQLTMRPTPCPQHNGTCWCAPITQEKTNTDVLLTLSGLKPAKEKGTGQC